MKTVFRATAAAVLALIGTAGNAAQTVQAKTCPTPEEAQRLVMAIAPGAIRSVATTCAAVLPATAYLRMRGETLASRYAAPAEAAKGAAMSAIGKISTDKPLPIEMFDMVADGMVAVLAEEKIKPQDCAKIDRALELLDPLPPENLTGLITLIVELAGSDPKKPSPITICKSA